MILVLNILVLCFQAGSSVLFPPLSHPVLCVRVGHMLCRESYDFAVSASLPGLHSGRELCVLIHRQ